jgi:hypothetical protein
MDEFAADALLIDDLYYLNRVLEPYAEIRAARWRASSRAGSPCWCWPTAEGRERVALVDGSCTPKPSAGMCIKNHGL